MESPEEFDAPSSSSQQTLRRYQRPSCASILLPVSRRDCVASATPYDINEQASQADALYTVASNDGELVEASEEAYNVDELAEVPTPRKKQRGKNFEWSEIRRFDDQQAAWNFMKTEYPTYRMCRRTRDKETYNCGNVRIGCPHQLQLHFFDDSLGVSLRQNVTDHLHPNALNGASMSEKKKRQQLLKESVQLKHGIGQARKLLELHEMQVPDHRRLTAQLQYYRKVVANNGQPIATLSDLLDWIDRHSQIPPADQAHEPFVADFTVDRQEEMNVRFVALLTTRHLLGLLLRTVEIHN